MKIREVRATAFGPFRNEVLGLAPGMNIVHGPNEAGKSSWYAATYAGLAGRRKVKGRGTAVQAEFSKRHKPWSGSLWSAGVTVALDDGLVLAIEHDLKKGESRIVDSESGRPVSGADLMTRLGVDLNNDGTLDGSRLLGLNRDSVRATIFTGQADMLRVLNDAKELQEVIERAATTDVADSTAEGALNWLQSLRSERVGVEHIGTKPLRSRTAAQLEAREVSRSRRDALSTLVGVIDEQRGMSEVLEAAKADVDRAEQFDRWVELRADRERLQKAADLAAQIEALGLSEAEVDEGRIQEATMIIGAYDSGVEPAPMADAPTAQALEVELLALPAMPTGDLEPNPAIMVARQALQQAMTATKTHAETAPQLAEGETQTALSADQLRQIAELLEEKPPVVDPTRGEALSRILAEGQEARQAYEAAQSDYEAALARNEQRRLEYARQAEDYSRLSQEFERASAERSAASAAARRRGEERRSRGSLLIGLGIALALAGGALAALVMPLLGVVTAAGLAVLVLGATMRSSASAEAESHSSPLFAPLPPSPPAMEQDAPPLQPAVDPRIQDLQVAIRSAEQTVQAHIERVASVRGLLDDEGLSDDPIVLRAYARAKDDAGAAAERRQAHDVQAQAFVLKQRDAATQLGTALRELGGFVGTPSDEEGLLAAVGEYVDACRLNADLAASAGRRDDLKAALEQRRLVEQGHAKALSDRTAQGAAVVAFVRSHLGRTEFESLLAEEAAAHLREWLVAQKEGRRSQGARAELVARLDQLLEGSELAKQQRELAERAVALGPEPTDLPEDLAGFKERVNARYSAVTSRQAALGGQREQLSLGLGSVAEASELEASADRALSEVQDLRSCIVAATDQLQLAKERAHANIAPALEAKIRPWLPRVTGGRYLDVVVDPSDLTTKVAESTGAVREAQLLSQGTMEQVFLILRIALSQVLSGGGESSPFVLDDVTVQSDADRTIAILEMLHALSEDHQVVLFTQEQEVVDWARTNLVNAELDRIVDLAAVRGANG